MTETGGAKSKIDILKVEKVDKLGGPYKRQVWLEILGLLTWKFLLRSQRNVEISYA